MAGQLFFFKADGEVKRIRIDEILVLEALDNYVKFHALNYSVLIRTTLDGALEKLPENQFFKVHRSYAVSVDHIEDFIKDFVSLRGLDKVVPVGKPYYQPLLNRVTVLGPGLMEKKIINSAAETPTDPEDI